MEFVLALILIGIIILAFFKLNERFDLKFNNLTSKIMDLNYQILELRKSSAEKDLELQDLQDTLNIYTKNKI